MTKNRKKLVLVIYDLRFGPRSAIVPFVLIGCLASDYDEAAQSLFSSQIISSADEVAILLATNK